MNRVTKGHRTPSTRQGDRRAETRPPRVHLSLPGAHEDFPWGESVAKVQKKVFVFLGKPDDLTGVSVKLVRSHGYVASQAYASPTGYGLGKAGWLDIRFGSKAPSLALITEWVIESYCAVAPKKLISQLPD